MRILKKVLLYTTIIAVSVLAILVVFGFIFQARIVKQVITEVNKTLNSEIKVQELEFSLISNFPYASVIFNDVTGFESKEFSNTPDSLFHFQTLSLAFNVLDVIQDKFILESISVSNGFVNLEIDKHGVENFMIVKSDTTSSDNVFLSLKEVIFTDCTIAFRDFRNQDAYNFYFPNLVANGTFSSTEITTSLYGETKVNKLILDNTPYLSNEYGKVDVGIEIDLENDIFQISRGFVTLRDKYDFDVKGKSHLGKYKYTFKASKLDLRQAETLIPKKHTDFINTFEINGIANLEIVLAKEKNAENPTIKGDFDLWSGDFINKNSRESVKIPKAIGRFDMGKLATPKTTQIWVEKFELETREGNVTGKLAISNLKHPWFKLEAQGKNDLFELSKLFDFGDEFEMSGIAKFDINLTGVIREIDSVTANDLKGFKGNAKIELGNVNLQVKNVPSITNVNTSIILNQDILVLENFEGMVAGSKTKGIVQAKNWLFYVIDHSKRLEITTDLTTDKIETQKWISNSGEEKGEFSFPDNIIVNGHLKAAEVFHNETYLQDFNANISYNPYQLKLKNTRFTAFNGLFYADLTMSQSESIIGYKIDFSTQNVDVQNFLETYNSFGQTAVTGKHLRGDLDCNFKLSFSSDRKFEIDNSSILLNGGFVILNGEMIENKLLIQIPSQIESHKIIALFVNLDAFEERLHHIKFDTISNQLSIKNSVLTIPQMHISSSAINIEVSGTHSFSNELDYYLSFNLKEVLASKKKLNSEYGYITDDGLGNRMMFLHLYTKRGEVKVDLDKEGSKKYRHSKSLEDKNETKSILKEEFGFFKNDSTVQEIEPKIEFDYEIDLGEFEDDSTSADTKTDSLGLAKDSTNIKKKKKKKTKKEEEEEFEEFDFEDDDY